MKDESSNNQVDDRRRPSAKVVANIVPFNAVEFEHGKTDNQTDEQRWNPYLCCRRYMFLGGLFQQNVVERRHWLCDALQPYRNGIEQPLQGLVEILHRARPQ